MTEWKEVPTEDGYWLMLDVWRGCPELVIVSGVGTLSPVVERTTNGRRVSRHGMLKKAKWMGPILLPAP